MNIVILAKVTLHASHEIDIFFEKMYIFPNTKKAFSGQTSWKMIAGLFVEKCACTPETLFAILGCIAHRFGF